MKGVWGLKGDRRDVAILNSGLRIGLANAFGPVLCLCTRAVLVGLQIRGGTINN